MAGRLWLAVHTHMQPIECGPLRLGRAGSGTSDAYGAGSAFANGNNYQQSQYSTAVPGSTAAPGAASRARCCAAVGHMR